MNKNIITKKCLRHSYIVNDFGELRQKYVQLAKAYGYEILCQGDIDWLDHTFVCIGEKGVDTSNYKPCSEYGYEPSGRYELTLEDLRLHEEAL